MNSKQFGIILILGIVLGGAGYYLSKKQNRAWEDDTQQIGQKVVPDFPINDVAQIHIQSDEEELNLKKSEDVWVVQERSNYPANFSNIKEFISDIWNLKVLQSQAIGPSQLPRLELVEPGADAESDKTGTLVEFKNESGDPIVRMIFGKQHMRDSQQSASPFGGGGGSFPDGRYIMVLNDKNQVALVNEPFSNVEAEPDRWINKDFFKVKKIESVTVDHPETEGSWTVQRETETGDGQLQELKPGEALDTSKVSRVTSALSYPSFNDVLPADTDPSETGLATPTVAKIETFEDFSYELKIGKPESSEDYFMTVQVEAEIPEEREAGEEETEEDKEKLDTEFEENLKTLKEKLATEKALEGWIYKVSKWTVEPLLNKRSDFIKEPGESEDGESTTGADSQEAPLGPIGFAPEISGESTPADPLDPLGNVPPVPNAPEESEEPSTPDTSDEPGNTTESDAEETSEEPAGESNEPEADEAAPDSAEQPESAPAESGEAEEPTVEESDSNPAPEKSVPDA